MIKKFKNCPYCAEKIRIEAVVCRFCSHDLSDTENSTEPEKTHFLKDHKLITDIKNNKRLSLGLLAVILVIFVGVFIFYNSDKQQAKRTVDAYLKTIKTGKGNPNDYSHIAAHLGNVIDYKFLTFEYFEDTTRIQEGVYDKEYYDSYVDKDKYGTLEEYLAYRLVFWGDKAERVGDTVVYSNIANEHFEFGLLYDLTLTNKAGLKVFKKYIFVVSTEDFKIVYQYEDW